MIKLQRCKWDSQNKDFLEDIGSSLELPISFSITEVNTSKTMNKRQGIYTSELERIQYDDKNIVVSGTIFENASKSDTLDKKDEIMQYVSNLKEYTGSRLMCKIYQDKFDNRFWLGIVSETNIKYERQRSLIFVSITFSLEEPFQFGDRKTINITASPQTITNLSTVSFLPDQISSTGAIEFTLRPAFAAGSDLIQKMKFKTGTNTIYPKIFKGDIDGLEDLSFADMLRIPAGDYVCTGGTGITLIYWERFI